MVLSGKYAEVWVGTCNVLEFESADLTYGSNVQEYNSRAGGGATKTVDGVESGGGTINGLLDPTDSLTGSLTTGALVLIALKESSGSTTIATGYGRLGQFNIPEFNRGGAPVKVSIPFTTDGLWTFT